MTLPAHRRWRRLATVCCLIAAAGGLAGCAAAAHEQTAGGGVGQPERSTGATVRVLQMNLCHSGIAPCYSGGRAIRMAAALIASRRPQIVTLNEVCRSDVADLRRAMAASFGAATVAAAFQPAHDRRTNGPFRCLNGQEYGDGVVARLPSSEHRYRIQAGRYPTQDQNDPEERVWVCIVAPTAFSACTTHTASTSATIALAQCRYFMSSAVPRIRRRSGGAPVVLAGDLNLSAGGSPSPQSCLPPGGYQRVDDGALQDVVASPGVSVRSRKIIDMHGVTDHPGLLVALALPS